MSGRRRRSGHGNRALAKLHTSLVGYSNNLSFSPLEGGGKSPVVGPRPDQSGHGRNSRVVGPQMRRGNRAAERETGSRGSG